MFLTNDFRNVTNWGSYRVPCHCVPEQEEHVLILVVVIWLLILFKEVD